MGKKITEKPEKKKLVGKINPTLMELSHNLFSIEIKDASLEIKVSPVLLDELYYADFYDEDAEDIVDKTQFYPIDYLKILFYNESTLRRIMELKAKFNIMFYNEKSTGSQMNLLCIMCYEFYKTRYSQIKRFKDITEPIPAEIFINILNNQHNFEFAVEDEGKMISGILDRAGIFYRFGQACVSLKYHTIIQTVNGFAESTQNIIFGLPHMIQSLKDIGIKQMTPQLKKQLSERGKKFNDFLSKGKYYFYEGECFSDGGFFGDRRSFIKERIMIDLQAMRLVNGDTSDNWYYGNPFEISDDVQFKTINEKDYWRCSPYFYGYALGSKKWVKFDINYLSEIKFSEKAFDNLIIPEEYKNLFVACLQNDIPSFDDIIGKGCGKIFLLSGPAGCGKTMTAESVAEYLRLPLYSISVGELGVDPESLEENLKKAMEIATAWNAVLLIDEVDIFVGERNSDNIERNAMTAIFLRLLERYDGIMFMTTNMIDHFDKAFISRATAHIEYEALDTQTREKIWEGIIKKAEIEGIGIDAKLYKGLDHLARYNLNGREIKNIVRLAYILSKTQKKKMSKASILSVMQLTCKDIAVVPGVDEKYA